MFGLPVEGQPVDNKEFVEKYQGCQKIVVYTHLGESASSYGLSVEHNELNTSNSFSELSSCPTEILTKSTESVMGVSTDRKLKSHV